MNQLGRLAAAGALLLLALPISPASAHAAYKDSNPANKSTVSAPPSEVWAEFTEPPAQSSRLEIFDPCGDRVDSGSSSVTAYRITTSMSSDKQGTYTARFYVTSDLDSHPTTGSFSFTSTGGSPCPGAAEEPEAERPADDGGSDGSGQSDPAIGGSDTSTGGGGGDETAASGDGGAATGTTQDRSEEGQKSKRGGKHGNGKHPAGKPGDKKSQKNDNRSSASGPPVTPREEGPPASGDIPMDWLMISFGIAGAVGAAGGKVYAGLMGPR